MDFADDNSHGRFPMGLSSIFLGVTEELDRTQRQALQVCLLSGNLEFLPFILKTYAVFGIWTCMFKNILRFVHDLSLLSDRNR